MVEEILYKNMVDKMTKDIDRHLVLSVINRALIRNEISKEEALKNLTPAEDKRMEGCYRASGEVICAECGQKFYDHKEWQPSGLTNNGVCWLQELCDGSLVHL